MMMMMMLMMMMMMGNMLLCAAEDHMRRSARCSWQHRALNDRLVRLMEGK